MTLLRGIVVGVICCLLLSALAGFFALRFAWDRLHPSESDVYGTYVARYENGTQTVTLNRDHTYAQEVEADFLAEPVRNAGTWTWNADDREVILADCIYPNPGDFDGYLTAEGVNFRGTRCRYSAEWWTALIFEPFVLVIGEDYPLKKVD